MTENEAAGRECPVFGLIGSLDASASATQALMMRAFPVPGIGSGGGGYAYESGPYLEKPWKPESPCIGSKCMMWTGNDCGLKSAR